MTQRLTNAAILVAALAIPAVPAILAPLAVDKPAVREAIVGGDSHAAAQVSTADLEAALARGDSVVIDARPLEEYALGHIPGAVFLPGKPGMPASKHTADAAQAERFAGRDDPLILYCNGPNCGKTKRLADDLLGAGYTNVRRYQLGIPVWRALGGVTRVEPGAAARVLGEDSTAVLIDARAPDAFSLGSAPGAVNVPPGDVVPAEDDGRLPMTDHNTRIFVVAGDEAEAKSASEALTAKGFHNVGFIAGSIDELREAMSP